MDNIVLDVLENAANLGDKNAQYNLGTHYNKAGNDNEAAKWYLKAANQGHSWAQYNIGIYYENGYGVVKNEEEAAKWYSKAAYQGLAEAHCALAMLCENGRGVKKDYKKAILHYKIAADQGHKKANFNLGCCYMNGFGVAQSDKNAVKYFKNAAEQGYGKACYNLAVHYVYGYGIEQNDDAAVKYFRKAADLGIYEAYVPAAIGCYEYGSVKEAEKWAQKAQERGIDCEILLNNIKLKLYGLPENHSMTQYAKYVLGQKLSASDLYIQVEEDLKKDFGYVWNLLEINTKSMLITSIMTYLKFVELGEDIYKNLDFSASVLPMCKALENELYKYFFLGYINYLKCNNIPPEEAPKELTWKDEYQDPINYRHNFTLGSVAYILGLELKPKDKEISSRYIEYFREYFDSICKTSCDNCETKSELISFNSEVAQVCITYRNRAAHSDIMTHDNAAECGATIIKVKKVLRVFVEKIDVQKAKEYIEC